MSEETLTLLLQLRDEATKKLKAARQGIAVAAAAISAAAFKAGSDWDAALKTIAEGTGATGDNLKGLTEDFQGVARWGPNAAAAVADLNTHLGLAGPELRRVAEAALKAKIDTNAFGGIVKQTDRDVDGYVQLLDQLTAASQQTGASSEQLTQAIGRNSARWIAAGGDMEGLIATVVQAADEFGPAGLRGAMSQVMEEVDKGLVPAVTNLDVLLGDVTGRVESTYEAGRTWRDVIKENTSALLAQVGPMGDVIGGVGAMAAGMLYAGPAIMAAVKGLNLMKLALIGTGIGALIVAIGALVAAYITWKDEIHTFLRTAWNVFMDAIFRGIEFVRPLADLIGIDLPVSMDAYKVAAIPAAEATNDMADAAEDAAPKYESLTGFISGASEASEELAVEMGYLAAAIPAPLAGIGLVNLALRDHLAIVNNLTSTAIPAQIGLINTVQSSMGNVSEAVADNNSKWGDMKTNAQRAIGAIGASLGGVVGQITNIGQLLVSGDWTGAILAGVGMIVGKLKGLFGASKEELGRRDAYHTFREQAKQDLSDNQQYIDEVAAQIRQGQTQNIAEAKAAFYIYGQAAGKTVGQAAQLHDQFLNSVDSGNIRVMESILGTVNEWKVAAGESIKEVEVDFDAFFQNVTAEKAPELTAALIKMFAEGGEAGQQFANTTVAAFDRVGAAADRMASSIRAAMAAQRAQAVRVVIPRDAVTGVVLDESPSHLAWRGA